MLTHASCGRLFGRQQERRIYPDRRAEQAGEGGESEDWRRTKVHVGKHKGLDLCDLDRESVQSLIDKWLPTAKANPKPLADDRRLIAALELAAAELNVTEDNIPY